MTAICPTCGKRLERDVGVSLDMALALVLSTLVMLVGADSFPLMRVSMLGLVRQSQVPSSVYTLWSNQWVLLALLVAAFVIVLPLLRFGLLTSVLIGVRLRKRHSWLGRAFRWAMMLDLWAMPDVFLIGAAVGYSRVVADLPVTIGAGGYFLIGAAALCLLSRATLQPYRVWRAIGPSPPVADPAHVIACESCELALPAAAGHAGCPRCHARLSMRKPDARRRTIALVAAGFALYLPANFYPMSVSTQLGKEVPHRIIDGILELFHAGLWPLGVLIFCTSIAIPLLKLSGLSWMLYSTRRGAAHRLVLKTRLYRLIDEVGRWSNIDPFTIAVFVPVLQFGALASAHAAVGAVAFILVVVLTMTASRTFDPRLMWDAAAGTRANE